MQALKLPSGFLFAGVKCGLKESGEPDLALIAADEECVAAGVYTQNQVRAASIDWNYAITPGKKIAGVVINSGNANACTGRKGQEDNRAIASRAADLLDREAEQFLVLSTGVIGQLLPMDKVLSGIGEARNELGNNKASFDSASEAILTTDKGPKTASIEFFIEDDEAPVRIAGMAKGAGMIGPKMATMLGVIMTDAQLSPDNAQMILNTAVQQSFNRISVDGHTSTNDAVLLLCSGKSGIEIKTSEQCVQYATELTNLCIHLAKKIPDDGEGATHLITIDVDGAKDDRQADRVARAIASSNLVKTAIAGADPNWGRIVSAAGCADADIDVDELSLEINGHALYVNGGPVTFDPAIVSETMAVNRETRIAISVGSGSGTARHWTSDLTVDYVTFNSQYTT